MLKMDCSGTSKNDFLFFHATFPLFVQKNFPLIFKSFLPVFPEPFDTGHFRQCQRSFQPYDAKYSIYCFRKGSIKLQSVNSFQPVTFLFFFGAFFKL